MAKRRAETLASERRDVLRHLRELDRRGGRLARETIAAYERTRLELLGQVLSGDDTQLTIVRLTTILGQVEHRLGNLYRDLGGRFGEALAGTLRLEAEVAIAELRRLPWPAGSRSAVGMLAPRVPHGMTEALVGQSMERIKAVNADLQARIRGELTQSMLRGESTHTAAKRIMGTGLTLEGAHPAVPYTSVYARAETIARTELSTAANESHRATYAEAAKSLPGLVMRWSSALCSTTCSMCRNELHGQKRKPGEPFTASKFSGMAPPAHPRCLCRLVADLDAMAEAATPTPQPPSPVEHIRTRIAAGVKTDHDAIEVGALVAEEAAQRRPGADGLLDVLRELRPIGGVEQEWAPGSHSNVKRAVSAASGALPTAWLEQSKAYGPLAGRQVVRGYYAHHPKGQPSPLCLSAGTPLDQASVALHELGHRMEHVVPGILELERSFYQRRTAGKPLVRLSEMTRARYGPEEMARDGGFADPYMGKDYGGRAYELLTMGLEAVFLKRYDLSGDPEFRHFILGLVAAL